MEIPELKGAAALEQALSLHDLVVLDFWAPWCPPCHGFLPVLERAADRHPDAFVCRANTAEEKALMQAFEVESVPTLVVIHERVLVATHTGVLHEAALDDLLAATRELDIESLRRAGD